MSDPRRYAAYLLNSIFGSGMSSRLFQSIREERGLAYSIYSEMNPFRDTGSLAIYAGCAVDKTREVLDLTLAEMTRIKHELVTDEELTRAKNQLKGNMVLGLESSASRMSSLARQHDVLRPLLLDRRHHRRSQRRHPRRPAAARAAALPAAKPGPHAARQPRPIKLDRSALAC